MLRFASLVALTFSFVQTASADCAAWGLSPKVLTAPNTTFDGSSDGGILVAAVPEEHGKLDKGDAALQPTWRFKGRKAAPVVHSIAPGLASIQTMEDGELVDGSGKSLVTVRVVITKKLMWIPPPPVIKAVRHNGDMRGYHGSEHVTVEFADPMPMGTVAVILLDAKGKPKSWGFARSPTLVEVYTSGDCIALPNGTIPSKAGDTVMVRLVDTDGRVSQPTAPIKIVAQKSPLPANP